jgi:hypothetical protein
MRPAPSQRILLRLLLKDLRIRAAPIHSTKTNPGPQGSGFYFDFQAWNRVSGAGRI